MTKSLPLSAVAMAAIWEEEARMELIDAAIRIADAHALSGDGAVLIVVAAPHVWSANLSCGDLNGGDNAQWCAG